MITMVELDGSKHLSAQTLGHYMARRTSLSITKNEEPKLKVIPDNLQLQLYIKTDQQP